jgi:hypothetical protein
METRRWTNPSQPQTMQIAVFLLYARAVMLVLFGAVRFPPYLLLAVGNAAGGFGIANEKKWGYAVGVASAFGPALIRMAYGGPGAVIGGDPIGLMFEIALIALLLHPQSRDYQRIWFS